MSEHFLMKCGCTTGAFKDGKPVCPVHFDTPEGCTIEPKQPHLEGRTALCTTCGGNEQPSSLSLPFFEFKGEDSPHARHRCANCVYSIHAHEGDGCYNIGSGANRRPGRKIPGLCINEGKTFTPAGAQPHDAYYCGCRGWD